MAFVQYGDMESPELAPQSLAMPKKRRALFIAQRRKLLGMKQEELAEKADMSPGNLSQLENGKINYTQDSLEAIAAALMCEPADLFKDPSKIDELDKIAQSADGRIRQQIAELAKVLLKQQ